jgi:putative PIN family toxin of toxin-antitoxin system
MKKGVVIDTNVLVSTFITPNGNPARIVDLFLNGEVFLFYCDKIFNEYNIVLHREHFHFKDNDITKLLNSVLVYGTIITPVKSSISLPDEADRVFFDVAKSTGSYLITGNKKHFPHEPFVVTAKEAIDILPRKE